MKFFMLERYNPYHLVNRQFTADLSGIQLLRLKNLEYKYLLNNGLPYSYEEIDELKTFSNEKKSFEDYVQYFQRTGNSIIKSLERNNLEIPEIRKDIIKVLEHAIEIPTLEELVDLHKKYSTGRKEKLEASAEKIVKSKNKTKGGYNFNDQYFNKFPEFLEALKNSNNRYNSYAKWTSEDDQLLIILSETLSVNELCDHFKRMRGGIKSRLRKLDVIYPISEENIEQEEDLETHDDLEENALIFLTAILKKINPVTLKIIDSNSPWSDPKILSDIIEFLEHKRK
jgi:hypothetical protein